MKERWSSLSHLPGPIVQSYFPVEGYHKGPSSSGETSVSTHRGLTLHHQQIKCIMTPTKSPVSESDVQGHPWARGARHKPLHHRPGRCPVSLLMDNCSGGCSWPLKALHSICESPNYQKVCKLPGNVCQSSVYMLTCIFGERWFIRFSMCI